MPDSSDSQIVKAGQALKQIFELVGIKRVVSIDDEYGGAPSVDNIIGLCDSLLEQHGLNAFSDIELLHDFPFDAQPDIWQQGLRRLWDGLVPADQELLEQGLARKDNKSRVNDARDESYLDELMGQTSLKEIDFRKLLPTAWSKQRNALLQEAETLPTLFLFDIDLTHDGGTDVGGLRLLQETLAQSAEHQNAVICGLLTHKVSKAQEYVEWAEMANTHNIDRDRFVLISKEHLKPDPLGFARMVRLTALNSQCDDLKKAAARVLRKAQVKALKRVDDISVYDFDHIVFELSNREGLWEPDTIFRLCGLFLRDEARKVSDGDKNLRNLAAHVRQISRVEAKPPKRQTSTTWDIQRLELYEPNVNTYHLPIDLGDVFENIDTKKNYVLLAQSCDLAVRSDGMRGSQLVEVPLAEIIFQKPSSKEGARYFELEYFKLPTSPTASATSGWVDFRARHTVALVVLDFCVYNNDGSARLALADSCAKTIIPAWVEHYAYLRAGAEKSIDLYRTLNRRRGMSNHANLAIPKASYTDIFAGSVRTTSSTGTLSYNCKRINRLCQPRASALLSQFANYLTRAAFDVDLGQT